MTHWKTHPATGLKVSSEGQIITKRKGVNYGCNSHGYRRVRYGGRNYSVHRLIAEAFVPNPENKPQVNHKNGNKADNRAKNLEWVTNAENTQHAFDTGLSANLKGEANVNSKLSKDAVREIRQNAQGLSQAALGKLYGVTQATISDIQRRKIWKHVV